MVYLLLGRAEGFDRRMTSSRRGHRKATSCALVCCLAQVLPKFFILFEMDPSLEELFAVPLCDNCQDNPACVWCPADTARCVAKESRERSARSSGSAVSDLE